MAESKKLMTVNVVTPDDLIYSHKSSIVIMRTTDGERVVVYSHTLFLAPPVIGDVGVKRGKQLNNRVDHIAINGGYIDFSNNVATIITNSTERARNTDLSRTEAVKKRAEQCLEETKASYSESSYERASIALKYTANRANAHQSTQQK